MRLLRIYSRFRLGFRQTVFCRFVTRCAVPCLYPAQGAELSLLHPLHILVVGLRWLSLANCELCSFIISRLRLSISSMKSGFLIGLPGSMNRAWADAALSRFSCQLLVWAFSIMARNLACSNDMGSLVGSLVGDPSSISMAVQLIRPAVVKLPTVITVVDSGCESSLRRNNLIIFWTFLTTIS
jgi:hypothetical protein